MLKDKTIVSSATLLTSLLAYLYARSAGKDAVPYVMIGGFVGSIIGETIVETMNANNNNKP